jgi:hypothetical protein
MGTRIHLPGTQAGASDGGEPAITTKVFEQLAWNLIRQIPDSLGSA